MVYREFCWVLKKMQMPPVSGGKRDDRAMSIVRLRSLHRGVALASVGVQRPTSLHVLQGGYISGSAQQQLYAFTWGR